MKARYHYNASGAAVDEKNNFVSIKSESTETLLHRRKLLFADVWRNRKVRPAQIIGGTRPPEQSEEIEKALQKSVKAVEKINAELQNRKEKVVEA